jgi:hypothetical protein
MVKGVNKLIVEVANPDSEFFERAIFFVRPQMKDVPAKQLGQSADALIHSQTPRRGGKARTRILGVLAFVGTAGLGAVLALLVVTLL